MASQIQSPVFANATYRSRHVQVDPPPNLLPRLLTANPFVQGAEHSAQWPPRKWAQDFQQSSTQNLGIPALAVTALVFRAPLIVPISDYRKDRPQPDPVPNNLELLYALAAPKAPFVPVMWPDFTRIQTQNYQELEVSIYLQGPSIQPYLPPDLPAFHTRAKQTPQDFSFQTLQVGAPKPFAQNDWHLFYRARAAHQDHQLSGATTRGIPAGIQEPFALEDWPITLPRRMQYSEQQASPIVLLSTVVLPPFYQTDFQNPFTARVTPQHFVDAGFDTRGIPPAIVGELNPPKLDCYEPGGGAIVLLWSAVSGAFGYRLYVNGVPQAPVLTKRILTVANLVVGTEYVFNVVTLNAAFGDASPLSNTVVYCHGPHEYQYVWQNDSQSPNIYGALWLMNADGTILTDEQGNPISAEGTFTTH